MKRFVCPKCLKHDRLVWDSDASYEDRGIEGNGIVTFMHCSRCDIDMELYFNESGESD